jgi:hypothetical protein
MEPEKTINPELVKKCAEVAHPESVWINDDGLIVREQGAAYFDPTQDDHWGMADAHALMRALMKEGWIFSRTSGSEPELRELYEAKTPLGHFCEDESFPLLLLKCASAQFNIPVWV